MRAREKLTVLAGMFSILFFLSFSFVTFRIEMDSMHSHSKFFAEEKKGIMKKMIELELNSVEKLCMDWAFWDETYEFIESRDERYIASNLVESTFKSASLNLIVFVNTKGEIVYARFFDENWVERSVPDTLLTPEINNKTGIALVNGNLMLLSSKPILKSDLSGEERGYLLMGRIIGEDWFSEISKVLNAKISLGNSFEQYGRYIKTQESILDVFGNEVTFSIEFENPVYEDHVGDILISITWFLIILMSFSIPAIVIVDRNLISKISKLSDFLENANPGEKIELGGTDEIRKLAESVNKLLSRIAKREEEIRFLLKTLRHDLLNIFTSISGYLELAKAEGSFEFVDKAEKQVERAITLIKVVKQIEKGGMGIYRLGEVIQKLKGLFPVEIDFKGDADVLADEGIYIVFGNLIENSIKHGKATKILIEIEKAGDTIVKFRDNGKGFSDIAMEKAFREKYSESGSGFGLFIVKMLLEKYGGKVELLDRNTILMRFPNVLES